MDSTTMNIELHLYASLARYLPKDAKNKAYVVRLPNNASIENLIEQIKLPTQSIKLIFLNGIHADRSKGLKDGDRVGIFPPVGGG